MDLFIHKNVIMSLEYCLSASLKAVFQTGASVPDSADNDSCRSPSTEWPQVSGEAIHVLIIHSVKSSSSTRLLGRGQFTISGHLPAPHSTEILAGHR
jgi:hypothetical protein